jgi:hypothetical protein
LIKRGETSAHSGCPLASDAAFQVQLPLKRVQPDRVRRPAEHRERRVARQYLRCEEHDSRDDQQRDEASGHPAHDEMRDRMSLCPRHSRRG